MNSLRGIVAFVRTVSCGSFSAAARQLGVTTVAVSRNVQRLERELGVRLLQRSTRSLSMTEEGRRLYEATRSALAELESAHEAVAERLHEPSGLVRVLSPPGFGRLYVMPLLARLRARYPRLRFELQATDRPVDMIEEGYDLRIRIGTATDASLVARELARVPRVVCAAPSYVARAGMPSRVDELPAHDAIAYRAPSTGRVVRWEFDGTDDAPGPRFVLTLNDMLAVCDAAVAGEGLAQLPTFIAAPALRRGALVNVLAKAGMRATSLVMQYPARPLTPARVRVVAEFLYESLHDHADLTLDPRALARADSQAA